MVEKINALQQAELLGDKLPDKESWIKGRSTFSVALIGLRSESGCLGWVWRLACTLASRAILPAGLGPCPVSPGF